MKDNSGTIALCAFTFVMVVGWVLNIFALIKLDFQSGVTIEAALRILGIFAAPIGSIMGFFV